MVATCALSLDADERCKSGASSSSSSSPQLECVCSRLYQVIQVLNVPIRVATAPSKSHLTARREEQSVSSALPALTRQPVERAAKQTARRPNLHLLAPLIAVSARDC